MPILWQTLILLLGSLVAVQLISILLIISLPAPTPEAVTLTEIGEILAGRSPPEHAGRLSVAATPPVDDPLMVSNPGLSDRLAKGLGRPVSEVRLAYVADQSGAFPFRQWGTPGTVPVRHGQPYFFNRLTAAVRMSSGEWRIFITSPPPLISAWQARTSLWFCVSAIAMLPIALIFARRLTQPIRRLARAVQSLDIDDSEIAIPPGGPAELRLIATALSEMHDRLRSNARERAAMIAAIAHDLRTPLARIAFRVEASGDPLRSSVLHDIDQIRDMVGATVAYLRGDKNIGERSQIDLSKVAVSVATSAMEMGLPISLGRLERALIVGNRLALERLIQNLIENSIKYAGAGEISVLRVADRVELRVIDNGPGIPDQDMARMFEPFERREPSRSRTTGASA